MSIEERKSDIIDFARFEEATSEYYPWRMSSEEIEKYVDKIEKSLPEEYTTSDIFVAITGVVGARVEWGSLNE